MNRELSDSVCKTIWPKGAKSCITFDVFWSWSNRIRRGSEVALVEGPDLVRREGSDDSVQNASIMEEHEVLL